MEREYIESAEGSPRPADIFEPHMPGVDVLANAHELFAEARAQIEGGGPPAEGPAGGGRSVAIVTPGRMFIFVPCPPPGSMSEEQIAPVRALMPLPPLKIAVVSYTLLEAFTQDETKTKCIPFLGILLAFGHLGHNVLVFEGHPTAFETGVRDCDVLIVDSGMLPFIQGDWFEVARRAMRPGAKVFVHERKTYTLMPVAPSRRPPGWRYSEYDGEASYANCLLTTLARGTKPSACVTSGRPLPDLAELNTSPEESDWIEGLPFKYDRLDADKVIEIISGAAKWKGLLSKKGEINAKLVLGEGRQPVHVYFSLRFTKDAEGRRQLLIER